MSTFKMPTAYHPSNAEWVRPIESLTSDGVRELQRLNAENAKLRELVKRYHRLVTGTDELWSWQSVYAELRELGIEVDE